MSNVTLTIAGRKYQVASAAGEEAHIERLGQIIDDRLSGHNGFSGQSEVRTLLYAALILADEVHEIQGGGVPLSPAAQEPALDADPAPFEHLADRLEAIAERLESRSP